MKRFVRSEGYARARLVSAAIFIVLGAILIVRTYGVAHVSLAALPGSVLGLAMIALGATRLRDYVRARTR